MDDIESSKSHHHHHTPAAANSLPDTEAASPHSHITPDQRLQRILMFLEAQFGDCVEPLEPPQIDDTDMDSKNNIEYALVKNNPFSPGVKITIDALVAKVSFDTLEVECRNESLRMRVKAVVERAVETVAPFVDLIGVY